jgi:hypothetical protein
MRHLTSATGEYHSTPRPSGPRQSAGNCASARSFEPRPSKERTAANVPAGEPDARPPSLPQRRRNSRGWFASSRRRSSNARPADATRATVRSVAFHAPGGGGPTPVTSFASACAQPSVASAAPSIRRWPALNERRRLGAIGAPAPAGSPAVAGAGRGSMLRRIHRLVAPSSPPGGPTLPHAELSIPALVVRCQGPRMTPTFRSWSGTTGYRRSLGERGATTTPPRGQRGSESSLS